MSELEDAIVQARRDVLNEWAICAMSEEHERDKWEHICAPDAEDALARLERLVRLDEAKRVPCMGMIGEWDCLRRATTAPTVLCDRCDRIAELEAEIAEAVKTQGIPADYAESAE